MQPWKAKGQRTRTQNWARKGSGENRSGMGKVKNESVSRSAVFDSLRSHGLQPTRLPCPWNSPGKSTGVGCHCLLQGIFLTQGSNSGPLHCRRIIYHLSHQGSQEGVKGDSIHYFLKYYIFPNAFVTILCIPSTVWEVTLLCVHQCKGEGPTVSIGYPRHLEAFRAVPKPQNSDSHSITFATKAHHHPHQELKFSEE